MLPPNPSPLLTTNDLVTRLKLSRATIWRKRRAGDFPQPCQIGHGRLRWQQSDIDDWIAGLPLHDPVAPASGKALTDKRGRVQ